MEMKKGGEVDDISIMPLLLDLVLLNSMKQMKLKQQRSSLQVHLRHVLISSCDNILFARGRTCHLIRLAVVVVLLKMTENSTRVVSCRLYSLIVNHDAVMVVKKICKIMTLSVRGAKSLLGWVKGDEGRRQTRGGGTSGSAWRWADRFFGAGARNWKVLCT